MFKTTPKQLSRSVVSILTQQPLRLNYSQKITSSVASKSQWSSFLMSVNENDFLHCKLKEFYNSNDGRTSFDSWKKMFHSCRGKHANIISEIMNTPTHISIFKQLNQRAYLLESGYFSRKTGESSVILIGNRGIGKSTSYKNFVVSCQVFHPKVIPIYLSYENVIGVSALKHSTPIDLIFQELKNVHSLKKGRSKYSCNDKLYELTKLLESNDKYLILIVDNVEKLYEQKEKDFPKAVDHINWLSILSGDSSGKISLILSLSSNSLPSLLRSDVKKNHSFQSSFPLLNVEPGLSQSNFLEIKLPIVNPTNSKTIADHLKCKKERANTITFLTGGNPREISKLLLMEELDISYLKAEKHCQFPHLDEIHTKLLSKFLKKMLENNSEFFDSLCSDNRGFLSRLFDFTNSEDNFELDMNKVGNANLESFTPLKQSEAFLLWTGLINNEEREFKKQIQSLHDCGFLVIDGENIYPPSLWSLFQSRT